MTDGVPGDTWARLLADLEPPTFGELAPAAEEYVDGVDDGADAVEAALADGVLVEEGDGMFPEIRVDDESAKNTVSSDREDRGAGSSDDDPQGSDGRDAAPERDEDSVDREPSNTPLDDAVATVGEESYPPTLAEREYWVNWILDGVGRKRPVAPWKTGHAYPVEWNGDLPEDERPEAEFETAKRWADFDLGDADLQLPDDAQSDGLDTGLLLPNERPDREECITLIDWDDVRDPETEEIHRVAADYIQRFGGYVEVSTSGEGLHQFVLGGLRKRGKFIAPIDEEPFIGEDLPQVEIYDGGRHVAMTGRHVEGSDDDVLQDGQEIIDELVTEFADAEKGAGHRRYDPETGEADGDGDADTADHVPEPKTGEYNGPAADELRETKPDDRSFTYHAVVETFYRGGGNSGGYAHIQNWRLEGFAAALGERDNLGPEAVKEDLGGSYLDDTDVEQRCVHRTPERVDYGYNRAASGNLEAPSVATLVEYGVLPPEIVERDADNEYRTDPRELEATVDPRRAWDAAARVNPDDVNDDRLTAAATGERFACPDCGDAVDVVRAVAVREGLVGACDEALAEEYPDAYRLARETYGAPLPEYLTTSDAVAEWAAVLDVIGEVGFFDLDEEALASNITARDDKVGGDAVRALDPAWRLSESGESVLVFDSGTVWDADTERVLDALRFVALDSGLLADASDPLEGEAFTEAYRRAREVYGAPLPRWEPAADGARDVTPQLPPAEELVEARDLDGADPDALDAAREDVEALIGRATADADTPTVVTALPALGKTTGTVKTASDRPLSYLAPRKELQAQALDKAEKWGVDAEVLPVFAEGMIRDEVLSGAVSHVRERGKDRLRDRWSVLYAALGTDDGEEDDEDGTGPGNVSLPGSSPPEEDDEDGTGPGDIFVEDDDEDEVDLPRATCPTAEGQHGKAWALAVHVARRLGYTPAEIHAEARGLFGAQLPCEGNDDGDDCPYGAAWENVRDPEAPADLLVGSYVHAHVDSVRTAYSRAADGTVATSPRAVVLDEFPGDAFDREFGEEALDFATWLAGALREDVDDRRDMVRADLWDDEWVRAWLAGEADEVDAIEDAVAALARNGDLLDARDAAAEIRDEVDSGVLDALGLGDPLLAFLEGDDGAREAFDRLGGAVAVDPERPGAGVARWVEDAVVEPLGDATELGATTPGTDAVDVDALPVAGDLRDLVERTVAAVRAGEDGARDMLRAATSALTGGRDGCRRLAAWADDGYAHPDAHHLLTAVATPTDGDSTPLGASRVHTSAWAFDPDATDGTVLDVVETTERATAVVDRNDHGAVLHTPPARTAAGGSDVPLVGLDATGRGELWGVALGEEVTTADIHDTAEERAQFLEDALDLRVLQAADRPRYYEGDPASKDTDGDVALLEALAEEYAGIEAPRDRGASPTPVGKPAAITTKKVRDLLENDPRLDDHVAEWENYGNVKGSNELGEHRLAAVLGCQHFGDHAVEKFAALAGEEVDTDRGRGRGGELEYGSDVANAYLKHMTEDQTMQAVLRFARGDTGGGATVVARTSALREDLPVVGRAQVVETWNDTATEIARGYRQLGREFTAADVRDDVDVGPRQVRRVLGELVEAGYLQRVGGGDGLANVYERIDEPGAGEVDLPERGEAVANGAAPGPDDSYQYYTWNVRVRGRDSDDVTPGEGRTPRARGAPPAPSMLDGVEPPG